NRRKPEAGGPQAGLPLSAETGHCSDHDRIRRCDDLPLSENNMVARTDHGMIGSGTRSPRGPRMSPTPDGTLDDPQQTIADLKRQLAESNAERDEALQRETATSEVLQVINSSPGDLAPVFDAMLEKAHSLCGAELGSLVICDGEYLRAMATRGYPERYEALARDGFPVHGFRLFQRLQEGERLVHVS